MCRRHSKDGEDRQRQKEFKRREKRRAAEAEAEGSVVSSGLLLGALESWKTSV